MKKLMCMMVAMLIVISSFVGCSNGNIEASKDELRVGMDLKFYPFMYRNDEGIPTGFEVDIAKAFGESIGKEVIIVDTDFSMLIPALDTGDIDIIISDMSAKPDRMVKADFTEPYRYGKTLVLLNKAFATEHVITNEMQEDELFAIPNMVFAGLSGTIASTVPQEYGAKVIEFTEIASALMEVTTGRADALVGANTVWGDHAAHPDTTSVYEGITTVAGSSFAVKKGNDMLLEQANHFISSMYEEGGFYEEVGTKYDAAIGTFMQNEALGLDYIIYPNGKE